MGKVRQGRKGAHVVRRPGSGRDTDLPSSAAAGFLGRSLPEKCPVFVDL